VTDITSLNSLDIIFVVIVGFFLIRGLFRGLVTELGAIIGVVGGFLLANRYYTEAMPYVNKVITDESWVGIVSYAGVFLGVILLTSLLAAVIHTIIGSTPAAWLDHLAGLLLGGLKGVLICCVLLACITYFLPNAEFVTNSKSVPYLQQATSYLQQYIPERSF